MTLEIYFLYLSLLLRAMGVSAVMIASFLDITVLI